MLNIAFLELKPLSFPRINLEKIWSLLKVTEKPRFARALTIRDKDSDPREPSWLGIIYRDQKFGKEYLVASSTYREEGKGHREVSSIKEIESSVGISNVMTAEEFKKAFELKPAAVDVENDMIAFFKKDTEEAGAAFHDLRDRNHGAGTAEATVQTSSNTATNEPRFTQVFSVQDKDWDPREPQWLGTFYQDKYSGKQYFVVEDVYEKQGRDYCDVSSIEVVISSKGITHTMTKAELEKALKLRPADVDVENDMMDQFKKEAEDAGMIFRDLRKRDHGAGTPPSSALTNSLS